MLCKKMITFILFSNVFTFHNKLILKITFSYLKKMNSLNIFTNWFKLKAFDLILNSLDPQL